MDARESMVAYCDLLSVDVVTSDQDYVGWYPIEGHSRGKAVAEFVRSMRGAGWGLAFTDVRAVKRFMRTHPRFHPDEGRFAECDPTDCGATPVWRCELRGYAPSSTEGRLGRG